MYYLIKILTCIEINTNTCLPRWIIPIVASEFILKIKDHICKTMLWRIELKLHVTLSSHLFEDYNVYQMKNIVGGLAGKGEDRVERTHQDGKRSERIYCRLTNFKLSQISQIKSNDMMTNPQVKLRSKQIKNESKRKLKRKR